MKGSIRKRGNSFEYYFDVGKDENGKRRKFSKSGFKTKEEAIIALQKAIDEFENKGTVFKDNNMSYAQYLNYFMDNYVKFNCKARTQESYSEIINKHIIPNLGHYYLRNLSAKKIQNFLDSKYKDGYSKKSMDLFFSIINQSLKLAVHPYGFSVENVAKHVNMHYKFKYKKQRNLTKDKLYQVLDFLEKNNYEYYVLFMIAAWTGMRRSEILGLQWDDIDLENKIIYVRHQQQYLKGGITQLVEPKSASSVRDIVIGDTLVELLLDHKNFILKKHLNHDYVMINTKGEWMKKHNVANILAKIRKELGFNIGLHDIRHLHGTLLNQENANTKGIQQRLGHSNIATTLNLYVRTTDKIKINTANILENVL